MTTEEIKNLIDQKIAGQGTMVDVGGALPTILKEIVDMASQGGGGGDVKPIIITGEPSEEMTTLAQLEAIGITLSEVTAAAEGKRTSVILRLPSSEAASLQAITNAFASPEDGNYSLCFYSQDFNESGEPTYCFGYKIDINGTSATVTRTEL